MNIDGSCVNGNRHDIAKISDCHTAPNQGVSKIKAGNESSSPGVLQSY